MSETKTFLISGVTGRQGGASARHLLRAGHRVKGLTHTPTNKERIRRMGCEPVVADLRDPSSLVPGLKGVEGFHVVTDFHAPRKETEDLRAWVEDEIRQGWGALQAARDARVPHTVLGSVALGGATGLPFHATKSVLESLVRFWKLPCTITRPPYFMDDWPNPEPWGRDWKKSGLIRQAVPPDTPVPHIATDDVGRAVAWAFDHPEKSIGQTWELVGEVTTYPAIGRTLSKLWNRPVQFEELPEAEGEVLDGLLRRKEVSLDVSGWERTFGFRMTTFQEMADRLRTDAIERRKGAVRS